MRPLALTFLLLIFNPAKGQETITEQGLKFIKLCDSCTCSEIDPDGTQLVLNIQCSEVDNIESIADLDKIEWPENPNGLKIVATFDGLKLQTLSKLPSNTQVESLKFVNSGIKTYWPDPFTDVPNLKKLSLTRNDLTAITPDLFTKITLLEDLELSYNKLSELNPLDFKLLHHVKRFSLQSNQLKKIPVEALQPMTALEDLDLSKNRIYDLLLQRSEVKALKGIKRLNLNGNRIRSVMKDAFPVNNNFELLDLSNNMIEIVEEDSFLTCTNLRELNLAQNNITFVFALPPSLQIVILKANTLYHWPKFPSGIKYIDISYNRLTDWYNENIVNFENLEVLNVGGNQIKDMKIERKLLKLFSLDLSFNLLTEIPNAISSQYFPILEELRLDGNPIVTVYFKNIIALKTLYMTELNKLMIVDDQAFSNVVGRSDNLTEISNCFSLYLSNCPSLSKIKVGAFGQTSLCMLDISKNNLTVISKDLTNWSSITEGVNLQYNPWQCSCDLQWLLDDLLPNLYNTNSNYLSELKCASPSPLAGLRMVHFYNWTEQVMCQDMGAGSRGTYLLEPTTQRSSPNVSRLTLILGGCIIVALLIAIALSVYLVKSRRRYRVRQAALKRKRQSAADARNSNGHHKEQFSALNKA